MNIPSKEKILQKYALAQQRIENLHIRRFEGQPGPICLISSAYPGVWMEHGFDALVYAKLKKDEASRAVARNQMLLFLRNQKPDGRMPYQVMDPSRNPARLVGYAQIQECVSLARLCFEVYEKTEDRLFLEEAYEKFVLWDKWLCENRMTLGLGLIELFCLYDTGHDNSARLADIPNKCPDDDGKVPGNSPALPILAPDMNAVFYGNRTALSDMAAALGKPEESTLWKTRAEEVKTRMMELLYDAQDEFFYDRDRNGSFRKFKSISITNVFTEHLLDKELFEGIYARHMKDPAAFWTPFPFPSLAANDPGSVQDRDGNSWGFYSQALTALRCMRWMDFYQKAEDYDHLLRQWVYALAAEDSIQFAQELHPITGKPSKSSEWYSSAMLLYMYAVERLGLRDE